MSVKVFDRCPNCKYKPTFSTINVYQCSGFHRFCDKCLAGNFLFGYKCPSCTIHISTNELSSLKIGIVPWINKRAIVTYIGSLTFFTTLCFIIQIALPN
jgi:hypothetical protein